MAKKSPRPPRRRSRSPFWRADDVILARWRANALTHEEWGAALADEQPDVIDALVDAQKGGDAALVRELGARLVWGWVSLGGDREVEEYGALLSFDAVIAIEEERDGEADEDHDDEAEDRARDAATAERVRAAAEFFFENPDRYYEIVRVESRGGTSLFVGHILDGNDYPCATYFAGVADSCDAAMNAVQGQGYVSADDVMARYRLRHASFRRARPAVSFEMIEQEAVARLEEEKRVRAARRRRRVFSRLPGVIDGLARFEKGRRNGYQSAGWRRYVAVRSAALLGESREAIEAARTKSFSTGPPVAIADWRRNRQE